MHADEAQEEGQEEDADGEEEVAMPIGGILSLDLATNVGFALHVPGCEIESGSFRLPSTGSDVGKFLDAYVSRFETGMMTHWSLMTHVVFEAPIMPATTSLATARKLYSLAGMTEWLALRRGLRCQEMDANKVRIEFCGRARSFCPKGTPPARRREATKAMVLSACAKLGHDPRDDDEADALLGLHYAMRLYRVEDAA